MKQPEIQYDRPTQEGMYVVYIESSYGITFAEKRLLMWVAGRWSYSGSAEYYRGKVHGWIGPLPALKLEVN